MSDASPRDLIDKWSTLSAFAQEAGVTYGAAKQMRRRNSIPSDLWHFLAGTEGARSRGISLEVLAAAHAREPSTPEPAPCLA